MADRAGGAGGGYSGELWFTYPSGGNAVDHFAGALVAGRTGTSHDSLSKKGRNYGVCGALKCGLGGENMSQTVRLRLELIFYLLHLSPAKYHGVPHALAIFDYAIDSAL